MGQSSGTYYYFTLLSPRGAEVKVKVQYETSPSCTAVQWLKPAQTAGKVHPYLYTQCQVYNVMQSFSGIKWG